MIKIEFQPNRISQCDIFKDIDYTEYTFEESGILEYSKITFPFVIVLTQDCDLEQDYDSRFSNDNKNSNQDKWLLSVLVALLYNAEQVYEGNHLSEFGLRMNSEIFKDKNRKRILEQNQNPRYHYLRFPEDAKLPPLIIDFKHYFCLNVQYLHDIRNGHYCCSVSTLFREDISHRFSSFLSRIGLPEVK